MKEVFVIKRIDCRVRFFQMRIQYLQVVQNDKEKPPFLNWLNLETDSYSIYSLTRFATYEEAKTELSMIETKTNSVFYQIEKLFINE